MTEINEQKRWVLEYRPLNEIFPNKKNPRTISKQALAKLQKQIKEVGFHSPIKLDNNGIILGGNSRYKALSELNVKDLLVPCMIPQWKLTKRERDEILITDNVSDGNWSIEDLVANFELPDLEEWGLDDLNISFDVDEEDMIEPEVQKREKKMFCCPNCGHVNVKKAFEQADPRSY